MNYRKVIAFIVSVMLSEFAVIHILIPPMDEISDLRYIVIILAYAMIGVVIGAGVFHTARHYIAIRWYTRIATGIIGGLVAAIVVGFLPLKAPHYDWEAFFWCAVYYFAYFGAIIGGFTGLLFGMGFCQGNQKILREYWGNNHKLIIAYAISLAIVETTIILLIANILKDVNSDSVALIRSERSVLLLAGFLATIIGAATGVVIFGLISRLKDPKWARVLMSVLLSVSIALILGRTLGRYVICPMVTVVTGIIDTTHNCEFCGDFCEMALISAFISSSIAIFFGAGLGQWRKMNK